MANSIKLSIIAVALIASVGSAHARAGKNWGGQCVVTNHGKVYSKACSASGVSCTGNGRGGSDCSINGRAGTYQPGNKLKQVKAKAIATPPQKVKKRGVKKEFADKVQDHFQHSLDGK